MTQERQDGEAARPRYEEGGRLGRRAGLFFAYVLLGPPIGGLVAVAILYVYAATQGPDTFYSGFQDRSASEWLQIIFLPISIAFPSYIFGGLQAAATALILLMITKDEARFTYKQAASAAFLVGILAWLVFAFGLSGPNLMDAAPIAAWLGAIGIAASLTLRWLFRRSFAPLTT